MTRVYLDPTALLLASAGPGQAYSHVTPGAAEAVRHLVDGGFEVIVLGPELVLGPASAGLTELATSLRHEDTLPEHLEPDDWYLTSDSNPSFGRPRGGTTMLVGPRRPVGKVPLSRFDLETRDMASAAMEILTREAMA